MRWKGSYTVEAALLMTVILPLLAGIIYMSFYLHNVAAMQNAAYELAALASLQDDEEKRRQVAEERKREIISQAFLGIEQIQVEVELGKEKVSARLYGIFHVPGMIMRFFCENQMELCADAVLTVSAPERTVMRLQRIKKLAEEGKDGSDISP